MAVGLLLLTMGGCAARSAGVQSRQVAAEKQGLKAAALPEQAAEEDLNPVAYSLYVDGLLAEAEGDLRRAADCFRRALDYHPESCELGLAYAQELFRLAQPDESIKILKDLCPQDPMVVGFLAMLYRRTGSHDLAHDTYRELVLLDSTQPEAYAYLSGYYQRQGALDSAAWALRGLARIQPDNFEVLNELGRLLVRQDEVIEAKQVLRRSTEIAGSTENMAAVALLAQIYESNNQPDSAATVFQTALERDPRDPQLHREIARIWMERDSTARAFPHLKAVTELAPSDFLAQRQLAFAYFDLDSLDQADSILTRLIDQGPREAGNHYFLGQIAIRKQQYARAREQLLQVTELAPQRPDGWLGLAWTSRQLGDTAREIETYQTGLLQMRDEESATQLYFALGAAFERSGQLDSAITAFEEIIKHSPDHAPSLNYLGYALADRGLRLEYALELIGRAVRLDSTNAAYLDSYGWAYYRLGRLDSAFHYLGEAARLDTDPVIYDHLGDVYEALGNPEKAREWWQQALDRQPDNETIRQKIQRATNSPVSGPAER